MGKIIDIDDDKVPTSKKVNDAFDTFSEWVATALTDLNSRLEAVEAIEDGNNIAY